MKVLVDTSVWVEHFRHSSAQLLDLLQSDRVLAHPMIVLELACGTPPDRSHTLANMALLQPCQQASVAEVQAWVERERLYGLGCGLVDMVLLASACITPAARLWTLDKRLAALAERFGVAFA